MSDDPNALTLAPSAGEALAPEAAPSRRSARSEGRREARRAALNQGPQAPWKPFRVPLKPLELLNEEGLSLIDGAAFRILEESGLEFQNERALDILERQGVPVERGTGVARFDRELVREYVAKAPAQFTLHARNPERNLTIGGDWVSFSPVGGPPHASDLDRGRRPGDYAAQCDIIRLHQSLNVLHMAGNQPVEAQELPVDTRHLDYYRAQIVLSDRVWWARGIGRARVEDALALIALARGVSRERLLGEPSLMCVINSNSPRRVDGPLLDGLMAMCESGQPCIITPFTLAGAMAPVTIAGALAQQTAEALALVALTQMVRPGVPVVMGGFTSNVDMRSGAPAFGTPEYVQGTIIGGQIARRWKLPYRASSVTSSNAVDVQAAQETMMSLWACVLSHVNVVHHAAGWLEGGLTASLEKSIVDSDMIAAMRAWIEPLDLSPESLAVDAIAGVPTGGHFFGTPHTMARFETAFHRSVLADLRPYQTWFEDGARTATDRAHRTWKSLLASYEEPPIDAAAKAAVDDHIARRKAEIAAQGL